MSIPQPPQPPTLPDVPAGAKWDAFKSDGHKTIDFIAQYQQQLLNCEIGVHPSIAATPGFLPSAMGVDPNVPPQQPQSFDKTLSQIQQGVIPGMLHWQHPDFFGYFPAQAGPSSLLGDMIGNAMNTPGFSWQSAPSATELETLVMQWLVEAFGLPKDMSFKGTGGAVMANSITESCVMSLLAVKYRRTAHCSSIEEKMAIVSKLVVYVSDQAHFCTEKASHIVGIPYIRKIESEVTNEHFQGNRQMSVAALKAAVDADIAAGRIPCFVSTSFGATGICAIDDIRAVHDIVAKPYGLWLNIDAAYAGAVAMLPEFRPQTEVFGLADSLLINASKWMSTVMTATLFFFKDRAPIVASLNTTGTYLDNEYTAQGIVTDYKDYHIGLGRPFRSIKLYTTLQTLGIDGLSSILRRHILLAKYLYDTLKHKNATKGLMAFPIGPSFGLVCFTLSSASVSEALAVLKYLNSTNRVFMVHTICDGQVIFRISLAHPELTVGDMDSLANFLFEAIPIAQSNAVVGPSLGTANTLAKVLKTVQSTESVQSQGLSYTHSPSSSHLSSRRVSEVTK